MRKAILIAVCIMFALPAFCLAGGDMQWNWNRDGHTTDGSMSFKDEAGNPFEANLNPTGDNVKVNESTAREAPVVYVQSGDQTSTPSSGGFCGPGIDYPDMQGFYKIESGSGTEGTCFIPISSSIVSIESESMMMTRYSQGEEDYNTAETICGDLELGGYTDWYLPAENQLKAIANSDEFTATGDHWAHYEGTYHHKIVDLLSGNDHEVSEDDSHLVRCVRNP